MDRSWASPGKRQRSADPRIADSGAIFNWLRRAANLRGLVFAAFHKIAMAELVDETALSARHVTVFNVARREAGGRSCGDMPCGRRCAAAARESRREFVGRSVVWVRTGGVGCAFLNLRVRGRPASIAADDRVCDTFGNTSPLGMNSADASASPARRGGGGGWR